MYSQMWLTAGWTVAVVFFVVTLFLFAASFRVASDRARLLSENKEMCREADRLMDALTKSEKEQGILRTYQGQLLRQIAGLEKELKEERYSLESTKRMAREIVADREKAMQSLREENQAARDSLARLEAELAVARVAQEQWQQAYEKAGQVCHEAIMERNAVVDKVIGENQTLRRLLTQQLDAVRKASHALSPSDEWLAMLSKIEDEA